MQTSGENNLGYFAARRLHKSARRMMASSRRRSLRRDNNSKFMSGAKGSKAVKAAAAAAAATPVVVENLLPPDFDLGRKRPNIVLIICDDQGTEFKARRDLKNILNKHLAILNSFNVGR
jgi:hypothetical protein